MPSMKDAFAQLASANPGFKSIFDEAQVIAEDAAKKREEALKKKKERAEKAKKEREAFLAEQERIAREKMRTENMQKKIYQYTFYPDTWAVETGIVFADSEEEAMSLIDPKSIYIKPDDYDFKLTVKELDCSQQSICIFSHWE